MYFIMLVNFHLYVLPRVGINCNRLGMQIMHKLVVVFTLCMIGLKIHSESTPPLDILLKQVNVF